MSLEEHDLVRSPTCSIKYVYITVAGAWTKALARGQEWELRDQVLMSKVHAIVLKLERSCVLQQVVDRSRILEQHGTHGYFLRMIWMDNDLTVFKYGSVIFYVLIL